jgi:cell division protein ZipA
MEGFGWLLLFFGLLVIAGVYFYSRYESKAPPKEPEDKTTERLEPTLGGEEQKVVMEDLEARIESPTITDETSAGAIAEDAPQKIVTLRLIGREKKPFPGDELILSMRGIGLRHGKFGIFHRYDGNDESRTIFSAASLVEPGSFDLANIKDQQIPGISLFLVLPGPVESVEGFDLMMAAARALSQSLDGELLDESGSTLSIQRERYLREEIIQFQHSNSLT